MPTRSSSEGRRGWKIPRAIARRVKVSLFDRSAVSSSRPVVAMTSRADAVKAGRCCAVASYSAVARPRLDGGEHDVMLGWSGHRKKSRGTVFLNGCYELWAVPPRRERGSPAPQPIRYPIYGLLGNCCDTG